jgi:hypothetical protein
MKSSKSDFDVWLERRAMANPNNPLYANVLKASRMPIPGDWVEMDVNPDTTPGNAPQAAKLPIVEPLGKQMMAERIEFDRKHDKKQEVADHSDVNGVDGWDGYEGD